MKYKELKGVCKVAIEKNYCFGCQKLEMEEFTGIDKCNCLEDPFKRINRILGVQQEIKIT